MKTQWPFPQYAPSRKEYVKQDFDWLPPLEQLLLVACSKNHLDVVIYTEKQGANIHICDESALWWVASNGHLSVVSYLVNQGADIHADNEYALRWAASNGHLSVVSYLVNQGADIHANN